MHEHTLITVPLKLLVPHRAVDKASLRIQRIVRQRVHPQEALTPRQLLADILFRSDVLKDCISVRLTVLLQLKLGPGLWQRLLLLGLLRLDRLLLSGLLTFTHSSGRVRLIPNPPDVIPQR